MFFKRKSAKIIIASFLLIIDISIMLTLVLYNKYKVNTKNGQGDFCNVQVTNDNIAITVLCYHAINDNENIKDPIIIGKDRFESHLKAIKDLGFTTLSMDDLEEYILNNREIPRNSVLITFDDGYMDNYSNAYPLLKENNMKATIFVVPSLLDKEPYMTKNQVKEISDNGIDIESHTFSHVDLDKKSYDEQKDELKKSKSELEKLLCKKVTTIAYPKGLFNDDTINIAKDAGYNLGFTVKKGYADKIQNKYKINRVLVDYTYSSIDIKKVLIKSLISK